MDLISVIVPVYNVERYLRECVESIRNQSYSDLELILVDDGSTDGSGALCDALAETDSRIRVFHQENRGLSGARNTGIDHCRGRYITFIDSDDAVHPGYLEVLLFCKRKNCISLCGFQTFTDDNLPLDSEIPMIGDSEYIPSRDALRLLTDNTLLWMGNLVAACGKLYDRSHFEKLRFPEGVIHEDEFLAHRLFAAAEGIVKNESPLYYYRQRRNSITYTDKSGTDRLIVLDAMADRADFYAEAYPELLNSAMHRLLFYSNRLYGGLPGAGRSRALLVKKYRACFRRHCRRLNAPEKAKGFLFGYCPPLYHLLAKRFGRH